MEQQLAQPPSSHQFGCARKQPDGLSRACLDERFAAQCTRAEREVAFGGLEGREESGGVATCARVAHLVPCVETGVGVI